jgi:hypothetical protein
MKDEEEEEVCTDDVTSRFGSHCNDARFKNQEIYMLAHLEFRIKLRACQLFKCADGPVRQMCNGLDCLYLPNKMKFL